MDGGSDDKVLDIALLTVLLSRRQKRRRSKRKMWVPRVDREANTTIDIIPPFRRYI